MATGNALKVAGYVALGVAVIYVVYKVFEKFDDIVEAINNLSDNQRAQTFNKASDPIDVTPESDSHSAIVPESVQNVSNSAQSTALAICPESECHPENVKSELAFHHSEDFRTVTTQGTTHSLTTYQSLAIEKLWKATKNHIPELHQAVILEDIGACSKRLRDIFKSNMKAYKDLIVPGERKGTFRLNFS